MTDDGTIPAARRAYSFRAVSDPDGPPFRYDPVSERLFRGDSVVSLQPRAAALLGHLLAEHGRVVSRDELIDEVWDGMPVADSSVTEAVALARSALGDDRQAPAYIQTVPKRGYRFIAPVERVPRGEARPRPRRRGPAPWLAGAALLIAGLLGWWTRGATIDPGTDPTVPVRAALALPEPARAVEGEGPSLALSPDGRRLAYVAVAPGEATRLHVVDLEGGSSWPLERSRGRPRAPFFSPDGGSLAYFDRGRLLAVSLAAGRSAIPEPLASVPRARTAGGAWHREAGIAFSPGVGYGLRILGPEDSPTPRPLTRLAAGERAHLTPEFLPDGRLLFSVLEREGGPSRLELVEATGERRPLPGAPGGTAPRFVPPGSLLFARSGSLFSAPLDVAGGTLGEPEPLVEGVRGGIRTPARFAASREGSLALLPASSTADAALHWVDLDGDTETIPSTRGEPLDGHRISPDGRRLVGERGGDLWAFELDEATFRQLTASAALETAPVWGPAPGQVTFATPEGGAGLALRTMRVEAPGPTEPLRAAAAGQLPEDWSSDGTRLLFTRVDPTTGEDLWIMERSGGARPLVATEAAEGGGRFSPDGRWVAFVSDRSGADEIWVRPAAGPEEPIRLTHGGGAAPRWAPGGDAVFFRRGSRLYRLSIRLYPRPRVEAERPVLYEADPAFTYELAPGGRRVLIRRHGAAPWWREARLIQAWQQRRRGPEGR